MTTSLLKGACADAEGRFFFLISESRIEFWRHPREVADPEILFESFPGSCGLAYIESFVLEFHAVPSGSLTVDRDKMGHLSKTNRVLSYPFPMLQENYALVTGDELMRKVGDTENNFAERKTCSNTDGWLKTAVAFANSCPIGQPGILYVNVDDNGEVISQPSGYDFEKLQKASVRKFVRLARCGDSG